MGKKVTMQQRLMEFGLSAEPRDVENAIDTLKACLSARSPKPEKRTRKKRIPGQTATPPVKGVDAE